MTVLVVGITGASGAVYGIRLLEVLSSMENIETHLIVSEPAEAIIKYETDRSIKEVRELASFSYDIGDMGARISSGSFKTDGMIVAPCTVKTMSAIANSYSENLLVRVGDVTLKERRQLLLLVRETPLHLGHLRNMERLCEMGAIIMPPAPAFYHRPQAIQDIVDHTVGKILDMFGIEHTLFQRWPGMAEQDENLGTH
jgi:4-hydroxy-3-polyprenylbenzoate decarboxylase